MFIPSTRERAFIWIPGFSCIHIYTAFRFSFSRTFRYVTLFWPRRSHTESEKRICIGMKSAGADTHTNSRIRIFRGTFQTYSGVESAGSRSGYRPETG
ncbi:MAG: hypothetical protein WBJ06_07405 [Candidatus Methanoculleus thermohydrogenotrophicum]